MHALTDITGFGLLGHTLELARGSKLTARVRYADLPWLPGVVDFAEAGVFTGASGRNWMLMVKIFRCRRRLPCRARAPCSPTRKPRAACWFRASPDTVNDVLALFHADGFGDARVIGEMVAGEGRA